MTLQVTIPLDRTFSGATYNDVLVITTGLRYMVKEMFTTHTTVLLESKDMYIEHNNEFPHTERQMMIIQQMLLAN